MSTWRSATGRFTTTSGLDDAYFGGKVLRLNRDGSAPADNPHFDPAQPDAPVSYQWAKGLRNFVALVQRPGDDALYTAENGHDIDRLLRLEAGQNYGYAGTDSSLLQRGLWFFSPAIAPVGVAFAIDGSFPADRQGNLYMGAFGPEPHSFLMGPIDHGKEIWEIDLDATGAVRGRPTTFVKYVGHGAAPITGVAYLPDGLYFLDFGPELPRDAQPGATGRLWRVVPDGLRPRRSQAPDRVPMGRRFRRWSAAGGPPRTSAQQCRLRRVRQGPPQHAAEQHARHTTLPCRDPGKPAGCALSRWSGHLRLPRTCRGNDR